METAYQEASSPLLASPEAAPPETVMITFS